MEISVPLHSCSMICFVFQVDMDREDIQSILQQRGLMQIRLDDTSLHEIPQAGEVQPVQVKFIL